MALNGQLAIVTGGTRGLGLAIATRLGLDGATVVCVARKEPEIPLELPRESAGRLLYEHANVSDPAAVTGLVDHTVQQHGRLDILVTNAGISRDGKIARLGTEQWREMLDVNLSGTWYCMRAAIPHMRAAGQGRIITISSVMARWAAPGTGGYAATKAGIEALTRVAAAEYGRYGIRVNGVAPGILNAGMGLAVAGREDIWAAYRQRIALGRAGSAHEVAEAVGFLAGPSSGYVNGEIIEVSGGALS